MIQVSLPLFQNLPNFPAYIAFSFAEYSLAGLNSVFYCIMYWEFPKTRITVGVRVGPHPRKITQASQTTFCTEMEDEKAPAWCEEDSLQEDIYIFVNKSLLSPSLHKSPTTRS